MKTIRFYELNGEQKLDAISQMAYILEIREDALSLELEQGYDPNQDFLFIERGDELIVELRQL